MVLQNNIIPLLDSNKENNEGGIFDNLFNGDNTLYIIIGVVVLIIIIVIMYFMSGSSDDDSYAYEDY